MPEPDPIILTWRLRMVGGETRPNEGSCFDEEAYIGSVMAESDTAGAFWSWSMTASGFGANYPLHHGQEPTKEGAKAALMVCYFRLMASHPDNREEWQAHCATLRERMRLFATRHLLADAI